MKTVTLLALVWTASILHCGYSRAECGTVQVCDENGLCELKYSCWQDRPSSLEPREVPYGHRCLDHQSTDGTTVTKCEDQL